MPSLPELYDKVHGLRIARGADEMIVWYAQSDEPGKGNFSKYVDERVATYPKTTTLRACFVTSPIVRGMLQRRGWVEDGMDMVRPGVPEEEPTSPAS